MMFASSSAEKFAEASAILEGLGVSAGFLQCRLQEIQSDSLEEIAAHKAAQAYRECRRPSIADDSGLYVDALGGFPGPYSSHALRTVGLGAVPALLRAERCRRLPRTATFRAAVAYAGHGGATAAFSGEARGTVLDRPRGKGWGYDPIFVPAGPAAGAAAVGAPVAPRGARAPTFAELAAAGRKDAISHRRKALERFAAWFKSRKPAP